MDKKLLRIGEVAARAGVSTRTVDFYTGLGLLTPAGRTSGNFRLYAATVVDRIAAIRRLEGSGVSLDDIAGAMRARLVEDDVVSLLRQFQQDLDQLDATRKNARPETQGLLAAITVKAHDLISAALEIAADRSSFDARPAAAGLPSDALPGDR